MTIASQIQNVILRTENVGFYIQKGLVALRDNAGIHSFISGVPELAKFAEKLIGLIPVVNEVESVLGMADWAVENWDAVVALGAAVHFKSFDSGGQDFQSKVLADRAIPGG